MNNWCIFFGFPRIFLLGILICKGLTARRFYTSFGVKGLNMRCLNVDVTLDCMRADFMDKYLNDACYSLNS
jgi:hypothetical protein